jgi:hypothetical protein
MPGVKTAISLEEDLFKQANEMAQTLHISRSKLFALAIQDFLRCQENKLLLAQLNDAYGDELDAHELEVSKAMRKKHRKIAVGEQ